MTTLRNPTILTSTTRFRPTHVRAHSRSPSRSPVRQAQFTAQHLDPLLRNLSPDSTLKALQATETIPEGPEQDVLTKSITDATPSEREIGIRAAFAAQKLREWRTEISQWSWPHPRERTVGAGFLPPQGRTTVNENGEKRIYLGFLPSSLVDQYERRIDEIRDALETLEMEEIKDHVLQAHNPARQAAASEEPTEKRSSLRKSYGRMRDFTALITATVIQALPDLAIVTMLIETWNVRLTVLRELPMLSGLQHATRAGIRTASTTIRDPAQAPLVTVQDFETTKKMLGDKVSDLGSRIDKMLDLLEGQEDALPQAWIDSLETIELDYATWVVEAQRVATQNQSARVSKQTEPPKTDESIPVQARQRALSRSSHPDPATDQLPSAALDAPKTTSVVPHTSANDSTPTTQKPALKLDLATKSGHRRGVSEVSIADSAYSAFSDASKAEIVDATQAQVLPSPKVSVVESPSRSEAARPPMLQRASTASIEVISKDQLKKVDLRRSMSADLLAKMSQTPDSTPSKALEQLAGRPRTGTTPLAELEDPTSRLIPERGISFADLPSPSIEVEPLRIRSKSNDEEVNDTPALPRRSSRRKPMVIGNLTSQSGESSPTDIVSPITPEDAKPSQDLPSSAHTATRKKVDAEGESLEAKIQDILLKLPTNIRLARNGNQSTADSSASSTRASTPTPALTLSPVKPSRRHSTGDTDVRVFHLTQHGQSRDTAPIKLFVRTVGENGERVMVRVGGGWADLGEYLKEYSLHHGRRSVSEAQLEVAQYPGKLRKEMVPGALRKPRHVRGHSRSPSPPPRNGTDDKVWAPPPVPPIPASYTVQSPVLTSITKPNGTVETKIEDPEPSGLDYNKVDDLTSNDATATVRSNTITVPGVTTTTTISVPQHAKAGKYTPLGAAGPKAAGRRSVTFGATPAEGNEAWVEGMVGKARAVSSNVVQGPTTTTTTKVVGSAPSSRRASAMVLPPASQKTANSAPPTKETPQVSKRKSLLGLGDSGSIRRVFLRKKSEK